jgi:hypothetical protein
LIFTSLNANNTIFTFQTGSFKCIEIAMEEIHGQDIRVIFSLKQGKPLLLKICSHRIWQSFLWTVTAVKEKKRKTPCYKQSFIIFVKYLYMCTHTHFSFCWTEYIEPGLTEALCIFCIYIHVITCKMYIVKNRPVLSSERVTHINKPTAVRQKKNLVLSPKWVLDTEPDWPTDHRS